MRRLFLSFFSLIIAIPAVIAQEKSTETPNPNAWSQRVYRFPSHQLSHGFVTRDKGQLRAPALPAANAGEKEVIAFLKKKHRYRHCSSHRAGCRHSQGDTLRV